MFNIKVKSALLPLFIFISLSSFAQENNVLSRFGMGDLHGSSPAVLRSWGGLGAAYSNIARFNSENPASLGSIGGSIFDFAAYGNYQSVKTNSSKGEFGYSAPEYFSLAVPLKRNKAGLAFGLQTFTRNTYNIKQDNDSTDANANSYNTYYGSGGTYKAFLASGIKFKNFSVGLKANYVFGTMDYVSTLVFADSINAYNSLKHGSKSLGDILLEGGIQYRAKTDETHHLSFGVSGNLQTNLNTHRDLLFERFLSNGVVNDTVYSVTDADGEIVFPMLLHAGIIYTKDAHWSLGAQFNYGAWGNYSSFGEKDSTADNWKIALGWEWIPNAKSDESYFNRVSYRFGAYTGTNYILLKGKSLSETGLTLGWGLPVRHSSSEFTMSFDLGKNGSLSTNNFQQYFVRGTFAFSLNDFWFVKRKYE